MTSSVSLNPFRPSIRRRIDFYSLSDVPTLYLQDGNHRIQALNLLRENRTEAEYPTTFLKILTEVYKECTTVETLQIRLNELPFQSDEEKKLLIKKYFNQLKSQPLEYLDELEAMQNQIIQIAARTVAITQNKDLIGSIIIPAVKELMKYDCDHNLIEAIRNEPDLASRKIQLEAILSAKASLGFIEPIHKSLNSVEFLEKINIHLSSNEFSSLLKSIYRIYQLSPSYNRKTALSIIEREGGEFTGDLLRSISTQGERICNAAQRIMQSNLPARSGSQASPRTSERTFPELALIRAGFMAPAQRKPIERTKAEAAAYDLRRDPTIHLPTPIMRAMAQDSE